MAAKSLPRQTRTRTGNSLPRLSRNISTESSVRNRGVAFCLVASIVVLQTRVIAEPAGRGSCGLDVLAQERRKPLDRLAVKVVAVRPREPEGDAGLARLHAVQVDELHQLAVVLGQE